MRQFILILISRYIKIYSSAPFYLFSIFCKANTGTTSATIYALRLQPLWPCNMKTD